MVILDSLEKCLKSTVKTDLVSSFVIKEINKLIKPFTKLKIIYGSELMTETVPAGSGSNKSVSYDYTFEKAPFVLACTGNDTFTCGIQPGKTAATIYYKNISTNASAPVYIHWLAIGEVNK